MPRVAGVDLQDSWKLDYALTRIKGIGWSTSRDIVSSLGFAPKTPMGKLSTDDISKITAKLESYITEGDLVRQTRENVQRIMEVGTYRGVRHRKGLPSRGQRTRSNARTQRGKRRTVGAFRKDALTKQTTTAKESK